MKDSAERSMLDVGFGLAGTRSQHWSRGSVFCHRMRASEGDDAGKWSCSKHGNNYLCGSDTHWREQQQQGTSTSDAVVVEGYNLGEILCHWMVYRPTSHSGGIVFLKNTFHLQPNLKPKTPSDTVWIQVHHNHLSKVVMGRWHTGTPSRPDFIIARHWCFQ